MIPQDFKQLLPKIAKDERPFCYLWSFDPETGHVHLEKQRTDHPADFPCHHTMATHIVHPERVDGYALAIKKGWRILTDEMHEPDPYIRERVSKALKGEHPPVPLPSIRYHGDPRAHEAPHV